MLLGAYDSVDISAQIFRKNPGTCALAAQSGTDWSQIFLLTHGPIISLRAEEPMHEDNGRARRGTAGTFMALVCQRQFLQLRGL